MLDYYARIAPVMLPHIEDRPLTMKRFPDGVEEPVLLREARAEPTLPDGCARCRCRLWTDGQRSRGRGGTAVDYVVVRDLPTLMWAANLGTIEFHVPLWHAGRRKVLPGPPDHLVFDLDPGEGSTIVECCTVGLWIAGLLHEQEIETHPKTSGSKGLQLYAPLGGRPSWDKVRDLARHVAVTWSTTIPSSSSPT